MRVLAKALLPLILIAAVPAFAQSEPPARVGRVSLISGTLAYFGTEDTDWSAAKINLPVAEGAWFATDPQSRAELRVGADSIDLAHDTQVNIAELRQKAMQLALTQGRLDLHLRRLKQDDTPEIDAPRGGVWLMQPGVYDIDSGSPDQPTRITVFEGSAHFVGGGVDTMINAGDALILSGTDTLTTTIERAAPDEFVRWCRSHDWHEQRLAAPYHVSPAMTGYEELDAYGEWADYPSYGEVWFPKSVPADWAPYREGRWVWVEPWGWNWVDDEPWGFAPFHYGRWAHIEGRWAWVPGEFITEPVYAPALVAFIPPPEVETAVSVAADAVPPIGWFPLAPGEVYWPSYTRDPAYIRNVNITNVNVTTITNITKVVPADPPLQVLQQRFANRAAATIVPATVLAASAPVAKAAVPVPPQVLQRASVSLRPPPVVARPPMEAQNRPAPNAGMASTAPGQAAAPTPSAANRPPQPGRPAATAAATPAHPPATPNFAQLAPAPRVRHPAGAQPQPASTPPSAQASRPADRSPVAPPPSAAHVPPPTATPGHPPAPPDFAHLPPARIGPHGPQGAPQQPAQAAPVTSPAQAQGQPPAAGPAHPFGPPDFAHLPSAHRAGRPSQQAGQGAPPTGREPTAGTAAPVSRAAENAAQNRAAAEAAARQQAQQRAASDAAARQQAAHEAQQRAASGAAARQQAQQRAAAEAAARQQAQQRAAAEVAARQQAQQRAAAEAAARQQAQQRAATEAAARQHAAQQAQQRAAAEAAARQHDAQQAQQRAAAEAAARQQAQQRAATEAAARQQAQQRAAAEAAARQQAAQAAQQRAAQQQAAQQAQQRAAAAAQQRAAQQAQQAAARQQQAAQQAQQRAAVQAAQQPRQQHAQACGHPGQPPCPH